MTREEFINLLDNKHYSYRIEGDKIVVNMYNRDVRFEEIISLPDNIIFKNEGDVFLRSLEEFPKGLEFKNNGDIFANSIENILEPVIFKNSGDISLRNVKKISPLVKFENIHGDVYFESLITRSLCISDDGCINGTRVFNSLIRSGVLS
jgi:hypothetical protein